MDGKWTTATGVAVAEVLAVEALRAYERAGTDAAADRWADAVWFVCTVRALASTDDELARRRIEAAHDVRCARRRLELGGFRVVGA